MPVIAQSPEGKVISVWVPALIRGADGKPGRLLKVGDIVRKGDQIPDHQGRHRSDRQRRRHHAGRPRPKKPVTTPAGDESSARSANWTAATAIPARQAGLASGGDGSPEGYRVRAHRRNPGHGRGAAQQRRRGAARRRQQHRHRQRRRPPRRAGAERTLERGLRRRGRGARQSRPRRPDRAAASRTIRVDHVPTVGEIHKADGTLVTAGTVLTPADLPGLTYVPPAEYDGTVPAGNFSCTLTTADGRSSTGGTGITLSPLNDAPVATPGSASGNGTAACHQPLGHRRRQPHRRRHRHLAARGRRALARRRRHAGRGRPGDHAEQAASLLYRRAPISTATRPSSSPSPTTAAPPRRRRRISLDRGVRQRSAAGHGLRRQRQRKTRRSPCTWAASMSTAAWSR